MKSKKWMYLVAVFILAIGVGYYFYNKKSSRIAYKEHAVMKGDLAVTILATGTVQPENRLEIKPPVAGRIDQVLVVEGQKVSKGQTLAWMSSSERAAMIDAARSQGADELNRWEQLYKPTPIVAPLAGTIISKNVESGQTFTASDAVLVMSNRLTVKAQLDETDLAQIKIGQACEIVLDSYPEDSIHAKVGRIAYEAKTVNNVTTYLVDVMPEKTPEFMRSGMTANVTFHVNRKIDIVIVPTEFIRYETGKPTLLVKREKEEPLEKDITLGATDGKQSEIVKGVEVGEIIVLRVQGPKGAKSSSPFSPFGSGRPRGGGGGGSGGRR
ncbi:MAG: efflux RND transporter periplasmic adaptor subunit [Bdellovibrionaceae bacterium]|nr:efflux RND transporter periplasmic adaptor subunit [Pseudobdellovibrionaceae bacterium]